VKAYWEKSKSIALRKATFSKHWFDESLWIKDSKLNEVWIKDSILNEELWLLIRNIPYTNSNDSHFHVKH
jgi:hypothetical protein